MLDATRDPDHIHEEVMARTLQLLETLDRPTEAAVPEPAAVDLAEVRP